MTKATWTNSASVLPFTKAMVHCRKVAHVTTRSTVQLALLLLCVVGVSAAPHQLQDFRMAAQIEHFDITCAPEFDGHAAVIGRRAENAYRRVASSLQHDLSFRPLLVLFETRAEQMRAVETRT